MVKPWIRLPSSIAPSVRRPPRARVTPYLAAVLVASLAAFSSALGQRDDTPLDVVATVGMVGDLVESVGGPCVAVTTLMGPGIDPHLYRASAGDVDRLSRADLIVYVGLNLEGQLGAVLARLGQRTPTLAVGERMAAVDAVVERLIAGDDDFAGQDDPHLWGAADLWAVGLDVIAEELARLVPACADDVRARAATERAQFDALHAWALASAQSVPEAWRTLVTSHDAFEYFGRAYGFAVEAIEGISTESEASIADIRETAEVVLATGVPAIFVETTISPRTIEAVQAAVRDRGGSVEIGGTLYGDAMGDAGTPEGTYVGMLRHNVTVIVEALGGTVAPWPEALEPWAEAWGLP